MKTVLVTGASSGIGLYIANRLLQEGYKVFGTSRNPDAAKSTFGFELLPLDITSDVSIEHCIQELLLKTDRLDVLVNNAGIGIGGSVEETALDLAEKQFDTNFWGTIKMCKAVLPLMRQQGGGRVISVGSVAGLISVPFHGYYAASKHALEGLMKALRFEVQPFNIHVSVIAPGFFKTNLHNGFQYAPPSVPGYNVVREHALQVFTDGVEKAPLPHAVADAVIKALRASRPKFRYMVGAVAEWLPRLQFFAPAVFEKGLAYKFRP